MKDPSTVENDRRLTGNFFIDLRYYRLDEVVLGESLSPEEHDG
jgi:hypothetical protein